MSIDSCYKALEQVEAWIDTARPEKAGKLIELTLQELQKLGQNGQVESKEASQLASRLYEAHGHATLSVGELDQAQKDFLEAVKLAPERSPDPWCQYAQLVSGKEAVAAYERALKLLDAEQKSSTQEQKQSTGRTAEQVAEDMAHVHVHIYDVWTTALCDEKEAQSQAERHLELAQKIDKGNPLVWVKTACLHLILGNKQAAERACGRAVSCMSRRGGDGIEVYTTRAEIARVCVELGRFDTAIALLKEMLMQQSDDVEAWYLLGYMHVQQKDWAEAFECLHECQRHLKSSQHPAAQSFADACEQAMESVRENCNKDQWEEWSQARDDEQPMAS